MYLFIPLSSLYQKLKHMKKTLTQRVEELEKKFAIQTESIKIQKALESNPLPEKMERVVFDDKLIELSLNAISDRLFETHNLFFWVSLFQSALLIIITVYLLFK